MSQFVKFLKRVGQYLNPIFHYKRVKEDIKLSTQALEFRRNHKNDDDAMVITTRGIRPEDLLRGRLAAAFFLSGPFGMIGIPLGWWVQLASKDNSLRIDPKFLGIVITILVVMMVTSLVYEYIWYTDNKQLYQHLPTFGQKFKAVFTDVWPVHWTGIRAGLLLGLVSSYWAIALILFLLSKLPNDLGDKIPANLSLMITEFFFIQGPLLRIMGEFFDKHSRFLAKKYQQVYYPSEPVKLGDPS
jgi:hypothetical protein